MGLSGSSRETRKAIIDILIQMYVIEQEGKKEAKKES
jgi:hypothetical protein